MEKFDIEMIEESWVKFDQAAHLRPIRSEEDYDKTVDFMNLLLDDIGDNEDHPMAGLLELVSDMVSNYDQVHNAIEPSEPKEVLRYLIELKGITQSDMAGIVPQSNLSAILAGKRKISATLAGKLAGFFNVTPALFIPTVTTLRE